MNGSSSSLHPHDVTSPAPVQLDVRTARSTQAGLAGDGATGRAVASTSAPILRPNERLFEAFIVCRTTLDDLSLRVAERGHDLSVAMIAGYLTGKRSLSAARHNQVADAINSRLLELEMKAEALYRPFGLGAAEDLSTSPPPGLASSPGQTDNDESIDRFRSRLVVAGRGPDDLGKNRSDPGLWRRSRPTSSYGRLTVPARTAGPG